MANIEKSYRAKILFLCFLLTISSVFTGCATQVYACEIIEKTELTVNDKPEQLDKNVRINGVAYECTYTESKQSVYDGEKFYIYQIVDTTKDPNEYPATVCFDADGNLQSFSGIRPFSPIGNITQLSDQELKETAEATIGKIVDFAQYTEFSATRIENAYYILKWQVKREILCSISVTVHMDANGEIYWLGIVDACADDFDKPFVSESERDTLIWDALNERSSAIVPYKFEIISETLSMFAGKNAIIYVVSVTDKEGFCEVVTVTIHEK